MCLFFKNYLYHSLRYLRTPTVRRSVVAPQKRNHRVTCLNAGCLFMTGSLWCIIFHPRNQLLMIRLTPRLIKIKWNVRNERPRSKEERERRRRKYIYIYTYIKDHYTVVELKCIIFTNRLFICKHEADRSRMFPVYC